MAYVICRLAPKPSHGFLKDRVWYAKRSGVLRRRQEWRMYSAAHYCRQMIGGLSHWVAR